MTTDELLLIYGSAYINRIKIYAYTETRHKEFLARFGVFLENFDLSRISRRVAITLPSLDLLKKILLAVAIVPLSDNSILGLYIVN